MESALVDQTSEQFLGEWKRLVSTTNWEKGRIIHEWREALIAAEAPVSEYSDDAWSRRVGNVTPQHVGRLRRVFERFGDAHADFDGLFWSHFQAALDWDDAEMWLEGAVQSDWSISEMRHKRWETRGAVAEDEPSGDVQDVPWDDDGDATAAEVTTGTLGVVQAPEAGDDAYDSAEQASDSDSEDYEEQSEPESFETATAPEARQAAVRPFASLPPLPPDVNDAFESYKLCILRHKLAGWQEIGRDDLVASLEALVQLALAPAEV